MIKTAVIIAGGEGSRLRPLTDRKPKTLVEVNGRPILYWIIRWLKHYGIKHVVVGVAYKKEKIYKFFEKNNNFGLDVDFSVHTVKGGTANGFKLALTRFVKDKTFLAMNGDELTNLDINKLLRAHKKHRSIVTMALSPFPCRFSVVGVDKNQMVTKFEYGKMLKEIPISIGVYIFDRDVVKYIPNTGSIENTTFINLALRRKVSGMMLSDGEDWISINTLKDIKEAEQQLGWTKN
jgi:NDP-sugar pyrophosphorylase family protein